MPNQNVGRFVLEPVSFDQESCTSGFIVMHLNHPDGHINGGFSTVLHDAQHDENR